jgi:membrane protein implicated in regulation of membrane protease activity
MDRAQGIYHLNALRSRWVAYELAANVLVAFAIGAFGFSLFGWGWALALFAISLVALLYIARPWKITGARVAALLNQYYPQLEESCALVLKPCKELNLLEKLQLAKLESALWQLNDTPKQITKHIRQASLFLALMLAVSFAIAKSGILSRSSGGLTGRYSENMTKLVPEKVLPQIASQNIEILPPEYTGRAKREQNRFTLNVEEGSVVKWNINTNIDANQVSLIFNETETIRSVSNKDHTLFALQKTITKPGFYQVSINGKLSDLYQVEVIKDNPPVIRIITPKPYTYIDAGEKPPVNITSQLSDDYGISNALLMATVAKGTGEAVKFKEYKIPFGESFDGHQAKYNLQKLIDLKMLDMEPGDELYFYIQATDNHNQQSRTDAYTVSIQDTASLLSLNGMVNGTNFKPEFFRSERQIILDAERLLKEKDTISAEAFKNRSNDLGIDQKLLRLRYGKFLGEESESNIGAVGGDEKSNPNDFSNVNKIMDEYADKHDNAEDAGFFEPKQKEQLKATLAEMWNAELRLRVYKPQEALAFAYKALRLLKDLQQKSRSYVAKSSFKPPPLKMEKRLSGEMKKIIEPDIHYTIKPAEAQYTTLKNSVAALEQLRKGVEINGAAFHTLQLAEQQLSLKASAQPGQYLASVSAMRRILASPKQVQAADIGRVEKAIQQTLLAVKPMPNAGAAEADMGLSQQYYKNLER